MVLTNKEREGFRDLFEGIADKFEPEKEMSRGAYKRAVRLEDPNSYLLALKIAYPRQIRGKALTYLRKLGYTDPMDAFIDEAKRMRRVGELRNPHISRLLGAGVHEDLYMLLEDYAERTLKNYVETNHPIYPLSAEDIIGIAEQLANGLAAIHSCDMFHGDLKPDNILFRNGLIVITDFGLASSLPDEDGMKALNEVTAPEVLETGGRTSEGDVWSYGVCMYFARAGEFPFPSQWQGTEEDRRNMDWEAWEAWMMDNIYRQIMEGNSHDIIMDNIDRQFDSKDFGTPKMANIVRKCLQRNPEDRFPSGIELYEDLTGLKFRDHEMQL